MHLADGIISAPVIVSASVAAIAGLAVGLRALQPRRLPQVAVLSAAFFVASLIHISVGPSSVHLILNGLIGVLLGWAAVPALFVGLLLQSLLFGFGGVTVLGLNLFTIAAPAVLCGLPARRFIAPAAAPSAAVIGGVAAAAAVGLTAALVAVSLGLSGQAFLPAAQLVLFAHIPVMVIEGLVAGAAILLIKRVRPEMLAPAPPAWS